MSRPDWWPEGAIGITGRDYEANTPVFTAGSGSETFHMEGDCHHLDDAFIHVDTLRKALTSWLAPNEPCKSCSPPIEECLRIAIQEDGVSPVLLKPKPEERGLSRTGHPTHFGEVEG